MKVITNVLCDCHFSYKPDFTASLRRDMAQTDQCEICRGDLKSAKFAINLYAITAHTNFTGHCCEMDCCAWKRPLDDQENDMCLPSYGSISACMCGPHRAVERLCAATVNLTTISARSQLPRRDFHATRGAQRARVCCMLYPITAAKASQT